MITKELDEGEDGLVYADIDLDEIVIAKNAYDPAGHYARPGATYRFSELAGSEGA